MEENIITQRQHQVLLGTLLGDAHLELAPNKKSARLRLSQNANNNFYIEHFEKVFSNWKKSAIRYTTKQPSKTGKKLIYKVELDTCYHPAFLKYHKLFYIVDPINNKLRKVIPRKLENNFTARSFAYLFMDDGGIKSKDSKGVFINTYEFTTEDHQYLCKILTNLGFHCNLRADNRIFIQGKSHDLLTYIMDLHGLPGFSYKVPPPRSERSYRKEEIPAEIIEQHKKTVGNENFLNTPIDFDKMPFFN